MYLAQLMVARLVQRNTLRVEGASFDSCLLRGPLLGALDRAWGSVIRVSIPLSLTATCPATGQRSAGCLLRLGGDCLLWWKDLPCTSAARHNPICMPEL